MNGPRRGRGIFLLCWWLASNGRQSSSSAAAVSRSDRGVGQFRRLFLQIAA